MDAMQFILNCLDYIYMGPTMDFLRIGRGPGLVGWIDLARGLSFHHVRVGQTTCSSTSTQPKAEQVHFYYSEILVTGLFSEPCDFGGLIN